MNVGITLENYRCFHDDAPASIRLEDGLTAIVGSNNSGKSTLLKFFWEFRPLLGLLQSTDAILNVLQGRSQGLNFPETIRDPDELFSNRRAQTLTIQFDFPEIDKSQTPSLLAPSPTQFVVTLDKTTRNWDAKVFIQDRPFPRDNLNWASGHNRVMRHGPNDIADLGPIFDIFNRLTRCKYIPAYRNAINVGGAQPYFDIQTGQNFIAQWRAWQTGDLVEHRRAARRLSDTIRDIFGYNRLEVSAANNSQTLELFIDGESFMLPELGSGLAQFIMVLATAAMNRPPFVLIDEPESNLHPSLQRDLLGCLASFATEGVLFATHNLGLALAQADRCYSVQRISHGRSEVHRYDETPRLPEFLGELSFAGYKQLGFDRVLLVEGITDLRAIQHFLTFYGKQHKVVLLPLGGNTMICGNRREELQEVQRICPHVHALIDSEKESSTHALEAPRQAFVATCASLSPPIPCKVLNRRSIENYYTDSAVKAAFGPSAAAIGHYDPPPRSWKRDNWRIFHEMKRTDIEPTDLGSFLDSL